MSKTQTHLLIRFLVLALACVNTAVLADSLDPGSIDPRPRRNAEEVGAALESWRLQHDVQGMAVATFRAGERETWLKGKRNDRDPVTAKTVFQAGQVANLLTALVLQALEAEGSISLDANVRDLVPEVDLQNPWADVTDGRDAALRVRHLLAHQAGVSPLHYRDLFVTDKNQPLLAGLNSSFRALRLEYPPGSRQQYSQAGYGLAAYLVERLGDPGYSRSVDILLSGLDLRPATDAPRARNNASLPGGMYPTLGDAVNVELDIEGLAALGQLMLGRGEYSGTRLLRAASIDALERPVMNYLPSYTAGGLRLEASHGRKWWVAAGAYPGHVAKLVYNPKVGRGYAVLVNDELPVELLGELENFLRGQVVSPDGDNALPSPRPTLQPVPASNFPAFWKTRQATPVGEFLSGWFDVARARHAGSDIEWQPVPGLASQWTMTRGNLLREDGAWWPARQWQGNSLHAADAQWQAIPGWQYYGGLALGLLVLTGWLVAMVHAFTWITATFRGRVHGYHEWLPRLLPLLANLALLLLVVVLLKLAIPEIGQPGVMTYSVLILSVLQPLLAAASLPAVIAGVHWKLGWRTSVPDAFATLTALLAAGWMIVSGMFAFQSWNF